jgi:hypothetical protein
MPIKLRTLKGTALTYEELDRNFSQVFYSASVANGNLQLWYTGSANLTAVEGGITVSYAPRIGATIPLSVGSGGGSTGTSIPGGSQGSVQYYGAGGVLAGDSGLFYDATNRRLGIGTISPTRHLQIQSNTTTPAVLRFAGVVSASPVEGGKTFMEFYRGDNEAVAEIGLLETSGNNLSINAKANKGVTLSVDSSKKIAINTLGVGIGTNFTVTPNHNLTLIGTMGIGDSTTEANQSVIKQLSGVPDTSRATSSTTQGLLIETPKGDFGGNLVVGLNTTTSGNEAFSIIRGAKGIYSTPVATFKAKGYIGLGTNDPTAILHVQTGSLGGVVGNIIHNTVYQNTAIQNTEFLEVKSVRTTAGADWTTSGKRIQMKVDVTHMGYMQFNGTSNNGGISFGAGTSSLNELAIPERMRIQENGNVGIGTPAPSGKFQVIGNGVSNPGGTAIFSGTDLSSHFYYLASEDTFIRGGKTTSKVYIGDANRVDSNDSVTTVYIGTSNSVAGYRVNIQGPTYLNGSTFLAGATTVGSTLGVTGATSLSSTLGVTGATNLNSTLGVTGATNLNSTLGVTGATTLSNALTVAGAANLNSSLTVAGNATITGTLTVVGGSQTQTNVTSTGTLAGVNVTGQTKATGYTPGNWYYEGGLVTTTVNNSATGPTVGFHNPGLYGSSIQLTGPGEFKFWQQNGTSLANITANNYTGLWKGADYTTSTTANTIVQRNASGHIFGTFLNVNNPGDTGQAILGRFAGFNSTDANTSDNYLRYYSAQVAANALSGKTMNIVGTATKFTSDRTNWVGTGIIDSVIGQMAWKYHANNHTIFDASAGTSPQGGTINKNDAQNPWSPAVNHPTLMGWNGTSTYGVRVDSARQADTATSADTATKLTSTRTNYNGTGVIDNVVGQLAWKSWAINNHTIFDASAKTSPQGTTIDHLNAQVPWSATTTTGQGFPNLMGWNGSLTHGVRVDSARLADTATLATRATTADTATKLVNNNTNYASAGVVDNVVGQLAWRANGNSHTIFDASSGTTPTGTVVGKKNSVNTWQETYPTLMGWANNTTYGVRVDSARQADICPDYLPLVGGTMGGSITFSDFGSATPNRRGIYGHVADNDQWFVGGSKVGSNAGFLELAVGDDGAGYGSYESIVVSQYSGYLTAVNDTNTAVLSRRAKLLDEYGNTTFPGTLLVGTDGHQEAAVGRAGFTNSGLTYPSAYLFSNTGGWGLWSDNNQTLYGNRQGGGALIAYNRAKQRASIDPPLSVTNLHSQNDITFYDKNATTTAFPENSKIFTARRYINTMALTGGNWTVIGTIEGSSIASAIRVTIQGTSGNVVINTLADIVVSHTYNITINSLTNHYTPISLRVVGDGGNVFTLEANYTIPVGSTGISPTTTVSVEIFPLNSEQIAFGGTALVTQTNPYVNFLVHSCTPGSNTSSNSGGIPVSANGFPIVTVTAQSFAAGNNNIQGYQRFNTGLIMQWGYISTTGVNNGPSGPFNLPIAYPNRHMSCVISSDRSNTGGQGMNHVYSLSLTQFYCVKDSGGALYISMGY